MTTPAKMVLVLLGGLILLPIISLLSGTILWLLWPVTAVAVWGLPTMTWGQCVCGLWTLSVIAAALKVNVEVK